MFSCLPMKHLLSAYGNFVPCLGRKNCPVWPQKRFLKMLPENIEHARNVLFSSSMQLLRCNVA